MTRQRLQGSSVKERVTEETVASVQRFCEAFNRHDLNAVMATVTDDCVLEGLTPYPDGARYEGHAAVKARWQQVFDAYPDLRYETEEMFAVGDRCIFLWVGHRTDKDGKLEHYRGIDVLGVRRG